MYCCGAGDQSCRKTLKLQLIVSILEVLKPSSSINEGYGCASEHSHLKPAVHLRAREVFTRFIFLRIVICVHCNERFIFLRPREVFPIILCFFLYKTVFLQCNKLQHYAAKYSESESSEWIWYNLNPWNQLEPFPELILRFLVTKDWELCFSLWRNISCVRSRW